MTTAREEYLLKSTSFRPSYPEITTEQAVILKTRTSNRARCRRFLDQNNKTIIGFGFRMI